MSQEMTTWRAAAGTQRVVIGAVSKGVLEAAASSQAALGTSISGAQDLPQGLAMGIFASSDRTLDVLGADCTSTGKSKSALPTRTGSTRHDDKSMLSCLRREVPVDHEAHSQTRQLQRVATTELRRERAPEPEA